MAPGHLPIDFNLFDLSGRIFFALIACSRFEGDGNTQRPLIWALET
jgi:hypothetical protein